MPIIVKDLSYTYGRNTAFSAVALDNVNLTINNGEWASIIGHTGSGKSTFVQHLNALIKLQQGSIIVDNFNLTDKKFDRKGLRAHVGMVFQYPEYQLFADTVFNDVAFGLKNNKCPADEIEPKVKNALTLVGLDYEYIKNKSPFELSGGEKRRVAIAGVIVTSPPILIFDEPTAGLDPKGKKDILKLVTSLKNTVSPTIITISHDMDEVSQYATQVIVFNKGTVLYDTTPDKLFFGDYNLTDVGLNTPQLSQLNSILKSNGIVIDNTQHLNNIDGMAAAIIKYKANKQKYSSKGGNNV